MKKLILFNIFLLALIASAFSQKAAPMAIPGNLSEAFTRDFPSALETRWMIEKDSYWVMFDEHGITRAVKYNKKGNWIQKEEKIEIADLPIEVTSGITSDFNGYDPYEAERVELPNTDVRYNVDLMKGDEYWEAKVSTAGKILGKTKRKSKNNWGSMD
jgi:hypothetical protein